MVTERVERERGREGGRRRKKREKERKRKGEGGRERTYDDDHRNPYCQVAVFI